MQVALDGPRFLCVIFRSRDHRQSAHGFEGHHFDDHRFDGHRRFGFAPVFPYYYPYDAPAYGYGAPSYWYYCASYGEYYPNGESCPDAWVPVPAS
jgi:hypothetical protein